MQVLKSTLNKFWIIIVFAVVGLISVLFLNKEKRSIRKKGLKTLLKDSDIKYHRDEALKSQSEVLEHLEKVKEIEDQEIEKPNTDSVEESVDLWNKKKD